MNIYIRGENIYTGMTHTKLPSQFSDIRHINREVGVHVEVRADV